MGAVTLPAHSRWSPSAAYRWMACPGSVRAAAVAPAGPSSIYAQQGTALAAVAELCLKDGDADDPAAYVGREIRGVIIGEDDVDPLRVYLDHIRSVATPSAVVAVERRLDLSALWPGLYGSADCIVVSGGDLHVVDLKMGEGVYVEVKDNPQLFIYALGALLEFDRDWAKIGLVYLTIVQPRYGQGPKVRSFVVEPRALWQWAAQYLLPALRATEQDNAPLNAGDHCRFCPARATCPALRDHALQLARVEFAKPEVLSNEDLATVLDRAAMVAVLVDAVRAEAHNRAERGEKIPGYILAHGRNTREWSEPEALPAALETLGLGAAVAWETKLRSVAQVEKALPRDVREVLKPLYRVVPGGIKLVKDDGRAPLAPSVNRDFEPTYLS